jgi:WD40 repeat protein
MQTPTWDALNFSALDRESLHCEDSEIAGILAFLAQDLLEKKPQDPITHMLESVLTFPFAGPPPGSGGRVQTLLVPTLCQRCNRSKSFLATLSQFTPSHIRPCCTYELCASFLSSSNDFMAGLTNFLNSSDSVMIVVGNDSEGPSKLSSLHVSTGNKNRTEGCDCSGTGKSRLRRWLTFPGTYVHKRRVLVVDSSNVHELVEFLVSLDSVESPSSGHWRHILSRASSPKGASATGGTSRRKFSSAAPGMQPGAILGSNAPTLTLIEGIEPPHSILHALMSRNFFRSDRVAACSRCSLPVQAAVHKTILFTRPGVFFKFPLPCPIFTIVRLSPSDSATGSLAEEGMFNSSFTNIILQDPMSSAAGNTVNVITGMDAVPAKSPPGTPSSASAPTNGFVRDQPQPQQSTSKRRRTKLVFNDGSPQPEGQNVGTGAKQMPVQIFRDDRAELLASLVKTIYQELCLFFDLQQQQQQPQGPLAACGCIPSTSRSISVSLDVSPTFKQLNYSRSRVEIELATFIVERGVSPSFDLSEFPNLLVCIVLQPRADVYITRYLDRIKTELRKDTLPSRLDIGNLLCLVCASQQCASRYTPPVTASDLLQLYLDAFIQNAPASLSPPTLSPVAEVAGSMPLETSQLSLSHSSVLHPNQETLMTLDIQNLVIENFQLGKHQKGSSSRAVLVSHSLLDARGADIALDLLQFLVRGTTVQAFLKSAGCIQSPAKTNRRLSPNSMLFTPSDSSQPGTFSPLSSSVAIKGNSQPLGSSSSLQVPLDHPVLLVSDITEVGLNGYEGHGTTAASLRSQRMSSVQHCFCVKLANDGMSIIIVVEKNSVVARTSFADPDTQQEGSSSASSSLPRMGAVVGDDGLAATVEELESSTDILWAIHFSSKKSILNSLMLSENVPITSQDRGISHDILLLVHNDASCSLISVNDVPRGANVRVQRAIEDEIANVSFVRKGSMGKRASSQGSLGDVTTVVLSSGITTPSTPSQEGGDLVRRLSHVSNNSRITIDLPSNSNLLEEPDATITTRVDFVEVIDSSALRCDDPLAVSLSPDYVAVCNQDSDLVVVLRNPFAKRNSCEPSPANFQMSSSISTAEFSEKFFQADGNVTTLVICNNVLVVGMETGTIQSFSLLSGSEIGTMEHHEGAVRVLRNMTKPPLRENPAINTSASFSLTVSGHGFAPTPPSSNYFIAGSDDSTITVWNTADSALVRTLRHHEAPVVDICAANFYQNKIIVSCDRTGLLTVVSLNPDDMKAPWQMLWISTFTSLRHLSLSSSGSWLLGSRHQQTPLAMPIAQWALRGNGQFHRKPISVLHISQSERLLFTGGEDGAIFVWRLNAKMSFLLCFRQHAANSTITSISTNSDETRVASADNTKFIYIWSVAAHATEMPKMLDRGGGGLVKYISNDYLVLQTRKGVKIMDPELKVLTSSNNTLAEGALDVYVASVSEYEECFDSVVEKAAADRLLQNQEEQRLHQTLVVTSPLVPGTERNVDEEECGSAAASPAAPSTPPQVEFPQILIGSEPTNILETMFLHQQTAVSLSKRCFIGVCRGSSDKYSIPIYTGDSLGKSVPCFELWRGDVEDEFGDEEEVVHTDTIKMFVFLQKKGTPPNVSSSSLALPNLHLAASAGDDLIVILWNWRKQQPLCSLQHTQFVNALTFLAPSDEAHWFYTERDMAYLRKKHPSFVENDLLVTRLVTCQDADSTNGTTLRVFAISENPRSFQKRFLASRCGQPVTSVTFDYKMLQTNEVSTSKSPNTQSMPRCIISRISDGLILTGHDNSNEVVFWKWLPECPSLTSSSLTVLAVPPVDLSVSTDSGDLAKRGSLNYLEEGDDDEEEEEDRFAKKEPVSMCLRPLRRLVSRV